MAGRQRLGGRRGLAHRACGVAVSGAGADDDDDCGDEHSHADAGKYVVLSQARPSVRDGDQSLGRIAPGSCAGDRVLPANARNGAAT
jgi:hypothetical protein